MNFFEMLVISKKMEFMDGEIRLYGQGIAIIPSPPIIEYIGSIDNDAMLMRMMYSITKEAMLEYRDAILKSYKGPAKEWLTNTINLYAHGRIRYENSGNEPFGEMSLENSASAEELRGRVKNPVDHILRGIIAGLTSIVLGDDFDVIETECRATGGNVCRLVVDRSRDLKSKYPKLYEQQVSTYGKNEILVPIDRVH